MTKDNQEEHLEQILAPEEGVEKPVELATSLAGDAMEEGRGDQRLTYVLLASLVLVVLVMAGIFYRFYPLTPKLAGSWEASTVNGTYRIESNQKGTKLILKNLNGYQGMDLVFESELVAKGTNEYYGGNTNVFLILSKKELGEATVAELTADSETFTVIKDSTYSKTVQYRKKALVQNFGDNNVDNFIKIVLRDFDWKLQAKTLNLRNDSFARGGISFMRVEE